MKTYSRTGSHEGDGKNWLGTLMFGLLYPAVLGTFFYSLLPETLKVVRAPMQLNTLQGIKLILAFLLIAHFLIDFYYTQQVALGTSNYPSNVFFLDLAIVLALFVAYHTVHLDEKGVEPEVTWIAGAMAVSCAFFRFWEQGMRGVIGKSRKLTFYETGAGIIFLLIAKWPNVYVLAGALVLSALLMYIVGGPIVDRFHKTSPCMSEDE